MFQGNRAFNVNQQSRPDWQNGLLLFFAYVIIAALGLQWAQIQGAGSPVWPAGGVGLAGLLLGGPQLWPAIFLGRIAAGLLTGSEQPIWALCALGASHAFGSWIAVKAMRTGANLRDDLSSVDAVLRFTIFGAGIFSFVTTFTGVLVLAVSSNLDFTAIGDTLLMGFFSTLTGVMVVTPLIMVWWRRRFKVERPAYFFGLMAFVSVAYGGFFLTNQTLVESWHLLPLLLWAVMAFRMRGAVTAIFIVAFFAMLGTILNAGGETIGGKLTEAGSMIDGIIVKQQFILIYGFTFLVVAAVFADRARNQEKFVRDILDNLHVFVSVLTPGGVLIEANRAPITIANLTPKDVLGKPFWETFWWVGDEARQRTLREAIARARNGETVRYDAMVRAAGGEPIWIDFQLAPLQDDAGRVTHLIATGSDLTERRLVNAKMKQLADIVEQTPDLVSTATIDGTITYINRGGRKMLGLEEFGPLPGGLKVSDCHTPERTLFLRQTAIPKVLETGVWSGENEIIRQDGTLIPIDQVIIAHRNDSDTINQISTLSRDIRRQKSEALQRQLLMRELVHRVRNTLTIIQSIARQMSRTATDPKEFAENFIKRINSMAAAHSVLTDTQWAGADIHRIIKSQLDAFTDSANLKTTGEDVSLPAEVSTKLALVLHELATNASKHGAWSKPGGLVHLSWERDGDELALSWREVNAQKKVKVTAENDKQVNKPRRGFGSTLIERSVTGYEKIDHNEGYEFKFCVNLTYN